MTNNISFTSTLKPLTNSKFSKITAHFDYEGFVEFPWKISSSRCKNNVYTNYVCDCSACLITDGKRGMLMHLLPSWSSNHDSNKIFNYINQNFNIENNNLQAVLIGSQPYKSSEDIFVKLKKILDKFKIPTTILKTGNSPTDIAYKTSTDEVYISNKEITDALRKGKDNLEALKSGFKYVEISPCDEI